MIGLFDGHRDDEFKGCALTRHGRRTDATSHEGDQTATNGQSETGALVFPGGRRIQLGERLEQSVCVRLAESLAGVGHVKANPGLIGVPAVQ